MRRRLGPIDDLATTTERNTTPDVTLESHTNGRVWLISGVRAFIDSRRPAAANNNDHENGQTCEGCVWFIIR